MVNPTSSDKSRPRTTPVDNAAVENTTNTLTAPPAKAPDLSDPFAQNAPTAPSWKSPKPLPVPAPSRAGVETFSGFALFSDTDKTKLREAWGKASLEDRQGLMEILQSPVLRSMTTHQREQLCEVACALEGLLCDTLSLTPGTLGTHAPLYALTRLFTDRTDNVVRLLHPSSDGSTALDHLARLVRGPIDPKVEKKIERPRAEVLGTLVLELADPRRIEQDSAATCTVTSVQGVLAYRMPGEYARLCTGLLIDGQVKLASGELLHNCIDGIEGARTGQRSPTERVFQAALMQWAHPSERYHTKEDGTEGFERSVTVLETLSLGERLLCFLLLPLALILWLVHTKQLSSGLMNEEFVHVARSATGLGYTSIEPAQTDQFLNALRNRQPSMRFDGEGMIVSLDAFAGEGMGHALVLVAVDEKTTPPALICRNSWSGTMLRYDGEKLGHAPEGTKVEDAKANLIRIPLTEATRKKWRFLGMPTKSPGSSPGG